MNNEMNNEKASKRKRKGMTLIEIIISLLLLSIMTGILVVTSTLINNYIKSANNVNSKVAVQAPVAESRYISKAYTIDENNVDNTVTITINGNIEYEGTGYSTIDPSVTPDDSELGGNIGLKFVDDIKLK